MRHLSDWLLFLMPPCFAGLAGVLAARWIQPKHWVGLPLAILVTMGLAVLLARWTRSLVRGYLSDAYADTLAGRPPLTEMLPGLRPLLTQLRRVQGLADTSSTALSRTNSQLSAVLEGMDDAVLAIDGQDCLVFANRVAMRMLAVEDTSGRHILQVVRDHRIAKLIEDCRQHLTAERAEFEVSGQMMEVIATPQSVADGPAGGVVVVFRDLSQLRRLESVRRDFVANVSHELKTPLASIKLCAETLSNGAVEDEAVRHSFLKNISDQADRLNRLIMELIQLARIESSKQNFDLEQVPLAPLVRRCLASFSSVPQNEPHDVQLTIDVPDDLTVYADEEAVRQIIENFLSNARKYTQQGEIAIRCLAVAENRVRIEVEDTGVGIAAEHLERLFERFYRVDRARARELGGTGLGLAIVKHLASALGGEVGVSSDAGRGSVFWVLLPAMAPVPTDQAGSVGSVGSTA